MPKKLGPEARLINIYNSLPDDSKRIVLDIIKAGQPAGKPRAQSAGKKSSTKKAWLPITQQQVDDGDPVAAAKREAASGD